jgi:hypothetical protein
MICEPDNAKSHYLALEKAKKTVVTFPAAINVKLWLKWLLPVLRTSWRS